MHHLVALSGGKDSTALALRLKELYPDTDWIFFCTPTGDELPEMEAHWKKLESLLGQEIRRVYDPDYPDLYSLIEHFGALPNHRQRWCTRILKIEAAQRFYQQFDQATIYVGLRADEEARVGRRGVFDENISTRHPFQEWGWNIGHVWDYLEQRGVEIPWRTDCGMCFWQRIGEWWTLWRYYPVHFKYYMYLEGKIGHTLMSPGKHKIWPHDLRRLAKEFRKGRLPQEIKRGEKRQGQRCRTCSL